MIVHRVDGAYELFRHFDGLPSFHKDEDPPFGAVIGVLNTVLHLDASGSVTRCSAAQVA